MTWHVRRVAYFFAKARECVRMARFRRGAERAAMLRIAQNWRDLAKDTRARWGR